MSRTDWTLQQSAYHYSWKTFSRSAVVMPRAKMIFRMVAMRQGAPPSIRLTVKGEMPAFRANSALLMRSDFPNFPDTVCGHCDSVRSDININ